MTIKYELSFSSSSFGRGNSGDHDLSQTNTLRGRPIIASPFMSLSSLPVNPPYPPYNYADHIPKPKVTYIKREEDVDERVDKLNGQVTLSPPFLCLHEPT